MHSYEPNPEAYALLLHNAALNQVVIDARKKGLGEITSRAVLLDGRKGNAGTRSLVTGEGDIEVVRLDDELTEADAMKLDVEGMELFVLRGAEKLITRSHPVIVLEVNPPQLRFYGISLWSIESFLQARGYRLFLLMKENSETHFGAIASLWLITFAMSPGFVFGRPACSFDIVAVPEGRSVNFPIIPAWRLLWRAVSRKCVDFWHRYLIGSFERDRIPYYSMPTGR